METRFRSAWRPRSGGRIILVRLLAEKRGVRNKASLPRLPEEKFREWKRAYRGRRERLATSIGLRDQSSRG
jgi:hypothetical protein